MVRGRKTSHSASANGGAPRSESQTRRQLIAPALTSAGWRVTAFESLGTLTEADRVAVTEYPTEASLARVQGRPYESAGELISRVRQYSAVGFPKKRGQC